MPDTPADAPPPAGTSASWVWSPFESVSTCVPSGVIASVVIVVVPSVWKIAGAGVVFAAVPR